jgi:hypothetical protein
MGFTTTIEDYAIPTIKLKLGNEESDIDVTCDIEIDQDGSIESVGQIWCKHGIDSKFIDSDDALFFCIRDLVSNFLFDSHAFQVSCREALRTCEREQ